MYVLSWRTVSAFTRVLIWCLTLSWALKQFVTRIHTLFSMYLLVLRQHHAPNGNNYQAQFQPFIHKKRSFITIHIKYEQISVHIERLRDQTEPHQASVNQKKYTLTCTYSIKYAPISVCFDLLLSYHDLMIHVIYLPNIFGVAILSLWRAYSWFQYVNSCGYGNNRSATSHNKARPKQLWCPKYSPR